MKNNHMHRNHRKVIPFRKKRRFPNAASQQYFIHRALDYALAAATSLGTVTILLFLITMA